MAKAKKSKKEDDGKAIAAFDPYAHLGPAIDKIEKKFDLSSMVFDKTEPRFSTSLLSVDLLLAGGLLGGGWYTCFGGEQSSKSTLAQCILASVMRNSQFKGVASYFDYEGSSQAEYLENIMKYQGVKASIESVFGVQDDATGEWIIPPRIRYYAPTVGEDFFNYLARLIKELPDKVKKGGKWWYVYDNTRDNQSMLKGHYDKKLFAKFNRFFVPAEDGMIQAIILTDSYPAMLPRTADEKDEGDKGLALQARMFAEGLKRVKGSMRAKRIVVLGINQLRDVPMAMYGPSEQEPGGKALKFFSDVRFRNSSVTSPHSKGMLHEEDSVIADGVDTYRYIKIKTHKNKLGGIPNQDILMRIVVENAQNNATGFCRVYDSYQYLKLTGQIGGNINKIKFVDGYTVTRKDLTSGKEKEVYVDFKSPFAGLTLTWHEFKTMIDGYDSDIKELCKSKGMKKAVRMRHWLEKQSAEGNGLQFMKDIKRLKAQSKKAKVSDADDEE